MGLKERKGTKRTFNRRGNNNNNSTKTSNKKEGRGGGDKTHLAIHRIAAKVHCINRIHILAKERWGEEGWGLAG